MLIYPLYAVLFARHGLSAAEISLLFVVWSVVSFALEVPTGVLADRFSRRHLLAVAQLVRAAGYLVWWLAPSFEGFAAGFVLWGIQGAITSGAFQALVFDELRAAREDHRYARIMGAGEAWSSGGAVVGSLIAAAVIPLGFGAILVASSAACLVTGAIALSFPAAAPAEPAVDHRYLMLLRAGVREVLGRRALLGFVVFSGAVVGLGAVEEFYALILRDVDISRAGISLWHAGFFLVAIAGNLLAHRVSDVSWLRLAAMSAAMGIALITTARVSASAVPITLVLFQGVYAIQYVAFDARLQTMITSRARATVTSVQGFVTELAAIATFLGFGAVASVTSTAAAAGAAGLTLVVVALAFGATASRRASEADEW
ncbi:MAG: MFS transporter [Acidimicrobiia bacterium]